jgi:hypothetical protein
MKLINSLLNYPSELEPANIYLCTTNTTIKNNGELVMGRGNALAFAKAYPEAPRILANMLKKNPKPVLLIPVQGGGGIGAFQTKEHWRNPSTIEIVQASTDKLAYYANKSPEWTFHLPFPAISNGGLTVEDILPIIEKLPNNVLVYKRL